MGKCCCPVVEQKWTLFAEILVQLHLRRSWRFSSFLLFFFGGLDQFPNDLMGHQALLPHRYLASSAVTYNSGSCKHWD